MVKAGRNVALSFLSCTHLPKKINKIDAIKKIIQATLALKGLLNKGDCKTANSSTKKQALPTYLGKPSKKLIESSKKPLLS